MCNRYEMIKELAGNQLSRIERNYNTYCRSETSMTQLIANMIISSEHTASAQCIEKFLGLDPGALRDCQAHLEMKTTNCQEGNLFIDLMLTSKLAVVVIEVKTWSPLHNDLDVYEQKANNIAYGRKVAKMTLSINKMPDAEIRGWKSLTIDELAQFFVQKATPTSEGDKDELETNKHDLATILAFSGYNTTDEARAEDNAKDKAHAEINAISQILRKVPNRDIGFGHENPWKVVHVSDVKIDKYNVNVGIAINFTSGEVVLDISKCGGIQYEIAGAIMRQSFKGEIRYPYMSTVFVKIPIPSESDKPDLYYADFLMDFITKVETS